MPSRYYRWNHETKKFDELVQERSEQVAPAIILDDIAPTMNHADGKIYTSKSKLQQAYKNSGMRIKEPGTKYVKKSPFGKEDQIHEAVQQARTMVRDGTAPLSEWDKHICKLENERLKR
jgi:hypothetical protein